MDYTLLLLDIQAGDKPISEGGGNVTVPSGFNCQCAVPWHSAKQRGPVLWDSSQPTRVTIPAGVSEVRFSCGIAITANDIGDRQVYLRKNGNQYPPGYISDIRSAALASNSGNSWTDIGSIMEVVDGDYFELVIFQTSGSDIQLRALGSTWLQCEIIE